jgi:hypothetical protein
MEVVRCRVDSSGVGFGGEESARENHDVAAAGERVPERST